MAVNRSPSEIVNANIQFHKYQASHYDDQHGGLHLIGEALLNRLISVEDKVLDLGTGTGAIPSVIDAEDVIGIDLSRQMLEQGSGDRVQALTTSLPFTDSSFDMVTTRSVLHHLPDLEATYKEVSRILRPGGQFIVLHEPVGIPKWKHVLARFRSSLMRLGGHRREEWRENVAEVTGLSPFAITNLVNHRETDGVPVSGLDSVFTRKHYLRYKLSDGLRDERFAYVGEA